MSFLLTARFYSFKAPFTLKSFSFHFFLLISCLLTYFATVQLIQLVWHQVQVELDPTFTNQRHLLLAYFTNILLAPSSIDVSASRPENWVFTTLLDVSRLWFPFPWPLYHKTWAALTYSQCDRTHLGLNVLSFYAFD